MNPCPKSTNSLFQGPSLSESFQMKLHLVLTHLSSAGLLPFSHLMGSLTLLSSRFSASLVPTSSKSHRRMWGQAHPHYILPLEGISKPSYQTWRIKVNSFNRINWILACKHLLFESCHERRKWHGTRGSFQLGGSVDSVGTLRKL